MSGSEDEGSHNGVRWSTVLPGLLFASTAMIFAVDLGTDFEEGTALSHLVVEAWGMVVGLLGAYLFWRRWRVERAEALRAMRHLHNEAQYLRGEAQSLRGEAKHWHAEAERWREQAREALAGLGVAIDQQFTIWGLTSAEAEVGLLLLKGLSFKEIAVVRATSERTARDQARVVYRKSGLAGRAELQAFFLEDLLLPKAPESAG